MNPEKQRGPTASEISGWRSRWPWLFAACWLLGAAQSACSSEDEPGSKHPVQFGDCDGRAAPITAGVTVHSEGGYAFELSELSPSQPVQSDSPPGNHWTLTITDPNGAKVTGATLVVNEYMPDHDHPGSPAVGIESGDGRYDVSDLILSMPTLYALTFILTLADGQKQTASLMLCLEVASG